MTKFKVRIYVDDVEIEAENAAKAEDAAMQAVMDGDIKLVPDYAEAVKELVDGKWEWISRQLRNTFRISREQKRPSSAAKETECLETVSQKRRGNARHMAFELVSFSFKQ